MVDRLQALLALTLSILIHTGIALLGDVQLGQTGAGERGPLWVTVTNLEQPAAAASPEKSSLPETSVVEPASSSQEPKLPVEKPEIPITQVEKLDKPESEISVVEPTPQGSAAVKASLDTAATATGELKKAVLQPSPKQVAEKFITQAEKSKSSNSESAVEKNKPPKPAVARPAVTESNPPLEKPSNRISQLTEPATKKQTPAVEKPLKSETLAANGTDKSTDQPAKETLESELSSTVSFAGQRNNGLAGQSSLETQKSDKSALITLPKPETTAIPLYHLIPKPPYPSRSRDLGEEGTVIIVVVVGTDGTVNEAQISKSSGYALLDGSALATVKEKWRFKPGTRGDKPVDSRVRVPIRFRIRDR